jgi:hypothetical protein
MKLGELECTDYRLADTHLYLNIKGDFATDLSSIDFSNLVITDDDGNTLQTYTGFELNGVRYNSDDETLQFDLIMGPYVKYATEIATLQAKVDNYGDVLEDILITMYSEDEDGSEN